jgi:hypothetical protein
MQARMDDLVWVNRDLEEKLQAALREHDAMDALLDEMEDEHEDAFARIHYLGAQVLRALSLSLSLSLTLSLSLFSLCVCVCVCVQFIP